MTSLVGQTIQGQFRVEAFVGSGGMGVVYRVWDFKRNVPLAMKVLHGELAEDPSVFKRFKREARALERLAHPNIVPFYGLHQSGNLAFLLERYIGGPSLKDILRQEKPLAPENCLTYLKAISSALGYAHAHGVVHCDVKPANVMIDQGGAIYLTDFGVARHAESTTTTIGYAGTVAYMAPEQCLAQPVTPQTDVYALGVLLFEMVTGERPFRGGEGGTESEGATAAERTRYAHVNLPPPDPRDLKRDLPHPFAKALIRALSKSPDDRFGTTIDLFERICDGLEIDPKDVPERATGAEMLPSRRARSVEAPFQPDESSEGINPSLGKGFIVIFGGVGVVLIIGLALFLGRGATGAANTENQEAHLEDDTTNGMDSRPTRTPVVAALPSPDVVATSAAQTVEVELTNVARASPVLSPQPTWRPYPNCAFSRLQVGDWTRVTTEPYLANRVRSSPDLDSDQNIIGRAEPGALLQVLDGPECSDQLLWWRVRVVDKGLVGWTAEGSGSQFWLEPGNPSPP